MKKLLSMLLLICLLLPVCSHAEEKLPRVSFPAKNYVGYIDYQCTIQMKVTSSGKLSNPITLELRDQKGRVWCEKSYKSGTLTFKIPLDASHEGGYDLTVWCGDTQVSSNSAYIAVTDRHRKVIQGVQTDQPYIALSFDCAYVASPTDKLLAMLDEMNIRATFFMTGEFVENFPEEAKKIRDAGHEIGCHSQSHPHMLEKNLDYRFYQVRHSAQVIRDVLGVTPRLFRPPFGEFDVTVSAPARAEGMEVCMWSISSSDSDPSVPPERIYKRITKNVVPGTIILFHLDGRNSRAVLPDAVKYYREELGLEFVTISELVAMSDRVLPPCPYED